jgi:hypothetical protein
MRQLNGQRQQLNGNNNGGKKRTFFENGRGGGNGTRVMTDATTGSPTGRSTNIRSSSMDVVAGNTKVPWH